MLTEILSRCDCARCRVCCVFDRSDTWEMPLIVPELAKRLERDFPDIKLKRASEGGSCFVTDGEFDGDGLLYCPLLTENGCALGEEKPFDCRIWPFRVMRKGDTLLLTLSPVCETVSALSVGRISGFVPKIADKIFAEAENNPEMVKDYIEGYPIFAVR